MTEAGNTKAKRPQRPAAATRRPLILEATAQLLRERSYYAVGIDEIGDAVGITGPAIYRYFRGKSDILLALLTRVTEQLHATASEAVSRETPQAALLGLIRAQVWFALEEETLLRVYMQERHTLPRSQTRPLRRIQHEYLAYWDNVVQVLRPDLEPAEARVAVRSVVELINSAVFYDHGLEREALAALLYDLAWRALVGAAAVTCSPSELTD